MAFIIHVDRLPAAGLKIEADVPRDWLSNIPEFAGDAGTRILGRIHLLVLVTREVINVRVRGRIKADLQTICTRCGEDLKRELVSEMDLVLIPASSLVDEEGHEPKDEDLDENYYRGRDIELDDYLREQIALDVPMTYLCNEDCKGLCARCGANLNQETCHCHKDEGDPRLAVLRGLKIK